MTKDEIEKEKRRLERVRLEEEFLFGIRCARLPIPDREFQFCDFRKFRADFAYPDRKILIEIQGGTTAKERTGHSTHSGIKRDCEKSNLAQSLGFVIFKFTSDMVTSGEAVNFIEEVMRS